MLSNFGDARQLYSKQLEAMSAAVTAMSKGWQQLLSETADYAKKSFEKNRVFAEGLLGAGNFDEALRLQSDFAKSSSEEFFAQANKLSALCAESAKAVFKPVTSDVPKGARSQKLSPAE